MMVGRYAGRQNGSRSRPRPPHAGPRGTVSTGRIGYQLGVHPSTVHRVLARYGLAKLCWLDRATGRVIRRYEHTAPGDLVHVDIKKLGRIPDGGGHRAVGRAAGVRNKTRTAPNRRPG
jgi:hypothetical protein